MGGCTASVLKERSTGSVSVQHSLSQFHTAITTRSCGRSSTEYSVGSMFYISRSSMRESKKSRYGGACGCSKMCLVVGEDCDRGISSAERKFGRDFGLNPIHGFRALWHSSKRSCVMRRIVHAETGMPVRSPKEFTRRGVRGDDAGHQPPGRR